MTSRYLDLTLILGGAVLASSAVAQTAVPQPSAAPEHPKVAAATPAAGARAVVRAPGTAVFTAAGSVVVLTDGVVSKAAMATIHPPAPGFVYER
jgi:hypothetical protein